MKTDSTPEDRAKVGADVAWLADNCRGPEQLRNRLKYWAQDYAQSHGDAFRYERVEAALHALVTLAHSNCSIRLSPADLRRRIGASLDFGDRGGYGASLIAILDILKSLPLPEEDIERLFGSVKQKITQQSHDMLEAVLSIRPGEELLI